MSFWSRLFGSNTPTAPDGAAEPAPEPKPEPKPAPEPTKVTRSPPLDVRSLRLQLFSGEATKIFDTREMLTRPLSPHLHMFIVEDIMGQSECTLSRPEVQSLGLDDDALFARARANAVVSDQPHVHMMRTETEGGTIDVFVSNQYYLGALLLTQLEQDDKDALVVLLTWHHALLHVLEPGTSVATVEALAGLAAQISAGARCQAMEWLSPEIHLYSATDRSLAPVTLDRDEATLRVTAPASLVALLHGA